MAAVLRSDSRGVNNQRTVVHHSARRRRKSGNAWQRFRSTCELLLWLLCSSTTVVRLSCVTTLASNCCRLGIVRGHSHTATAKQTASGHPNRNADRDKQPHDTQF